MLTLQLQGDIQLPAQDSPRMWLTVFFLLAVLALPAIAFQATATAPPEIGFLAQLGVGGVLAGFIFFVYRQDRKSSEQRYEELLHEVLHTNKSTAQALATLTAMIQQGEE